MPSMLLQETAGVVPVPGKVSRKVSSPIQLCFEVHHGAEIHPYSALSIYVHDAADGVPKIDLHQAARNQQEGGALVYRQAGIDILIFAPSVQPFKSPCEFGRHDGSRNEVRCQRKGPAGHGAGSSRSMIARTSSGNR